MHCHYGTNNRAPRWTLTDPCEPEVRPGAREESASPAWLAASAMNARDTTKVYIWRLDIGCGLILYRKCHSHSPTCNRTLKVHQFHCFFHPMKCTLLTQATHDFPLFMTYNLILPTCTRHGFIYSTIFIVAGQYFWFLSFANIDPRYWWK